MAENKRTDAESGAKTFDPTNHDQVAAYIDEHGFEAFQLERNRQTGFKVG